MAKKRIIAYFGYNVYLIISIAVLATLIILGTFLLGPKIINAAENPEELKVILGGKSIKGQLIFLIIQFLQVIFAFIPGEAIEVAAGYIYGPVWGTVLCLIGVFPATCLIFGLTKLLKQRFTRIVIDSKNMKKLKFLKSEKNLKLVLFLLYFLPGTPKDLITYFAGVTKIKFSYFLLISTFCRIPSILTSTLAGHALGTEKFLLSVIIFAVTGIVVLFGWYVFHKLSSKKKDSQQNEQQTEA